MLHDALKRAGHTLHAHAAAAPTVQPIAPLTPSAPTPLAPPPVAPHPVTPLPRPAPRRRAPWPEMVALYYNIDSLREGDSALVLQFVASRPGEGTSAVVREFASFAASDDTSAVLLIDCDYGGARPVHTLPGLGRVEPPSLADAVRTGAGLDAAITTSATIPNLHEARLCDRPNSLLHTNAGAWAGLLDEARQRYRFVLLDTPAISTHHDSVVLSRSCDGVVVVMEAEATRGPVARATIETIERFGGKVLGLVFNKRRFYIPRWIYRRL